MLVAVVVGGGVVGGGNGLFCGVSFVLLEDAAVGVDLTGDEPEVLPLPIVLSLSMILVVLCIAKRCYWKLLVAKRLVSNINFCNEFVGILIS